MSSLMPWPRKTIFWKCPKCGRKEITVQGPPWWICTCLPFFSGSLKPPICPKCKIEMKRQTSFSI